jgi:hypothetical protein
MLGPSEYLTGKITSAVGGLFGGLGILTFIKPASINEAFMRGGISTGSAVIFAGPILEHVGIPNNWDTQIASGAVIGFVAYFILGAVANFFRKNEKSDILEVVDKVKGEKK